MFNLKSLIAGRELIIAPLALNPLMARLAESAGFKAVYLGGAAIGWLKCVTEANLTLPELIDVAVDMRGACKLPIILDAGGGFGDPVHLHRTISLTEAAGCSAIEIEDQPLPRRVSALVGEDGLIPLDLMVAKIKEAVAVRNDPNLIIIGRTNALGVAGLDEALRRGEALRRAGADMLFVTARETEDLRAIGERLPPPLVMYTPRDGFSSNELKPRDLALLGYRLAVSSGSAFAAMYKALRQSYQCLAAHEIDPFLGPGGADAEMQEAMRTTDLDLLLAVERRTPGYESRGPAPAATTEPQAKD
ncbi:isocitrate lyase/PEP mutase family protein [Xanthobacteraceae bacterium Astr-EGSB]|uniref:isocitrate lyase/PEP mutase family protein n=1 Tax=Astrobacterium formosum TaxID=3069710 RepID=UPI0027AFE602|nr:isocitrate lyase/PEP mutase family protein [Xanthobacteraceae bacterium Astr-EGSB]